jgi:hypothetical protein
LGRLRPADEAGVYVADSCSSGPAVVGLWRPVIVVPADFALRYTVQEQALILLHETIHLRRGDLYANALCAAFQIVFWFNPLVHLSARRFRFDQELACDMAVLRCQPGLRRSYADAILKTQLADSGLPVGCNWQSRHPLKGRIMSMTLTPPHRLRRLGGHLLLAAFALPACYSAWAGGANTSPEPVGTSPHVTAASPVASAKAAAALKDSLYQLVGTYSIGGGAEKSFSMKGIGIGPGDSGFRISPDQDKEQCEADWAVSIDKSEKVRLRGTVKCRGVVVAQPSMLLDVDKKGGMSYQGDDPRTSLKLSVLVSHM